MPLNSAQLIATGQLDGFRNRIINGDMRIDQRNAGAAVSVNGTNVNYVTDRWIAGAAGVGMAFTAQRSAVVPAGQGFSNSLLVTIGSAVSPVPSGNWAVLYQKIEGYNIADFGFGASGASSITLSFWVRCSVSGTFGVVFRGVEPRSYVSSYSIAAGEVNTWVKRTITVPGDTAGTWNTTNGVGLDVFFDLGVGTGVSGAAGGWTSSNFIGLTGGTKLISTGGATLYITGVQLEKGPVATDFDFRSYGQELALCQRYYSVLDPNYIFTIAGDNGSRNWYTSAISLPATMRSAPTAGLIGSVAQINYAVNAQTAQGIDFASPASTTTPSGIGAVNLTTTTASIALFTSVQATGGNNNGTFQVVKLNGQKIGFSAEL